MYNRCLVAGKIQDQPKSRMIPNGNLMVTFKVLSKQSNTKNILININTFGKVADEVINNYKVDDLIFVDGYLWMQLVKRKYDEYECSFSITAQSIGGFEHIDLFEELAQEYEIKRAELEERLRIERKFVTDTMEKRIVETDEEVRRDAQILDEFIKSKTAEKLTEE